jgi:hypothetical protein
MWKSQHAVDSHCIKKTTDEYLTSKSESESRDTALTPPEIGPVLLGVSRVRNLQSGGVDTGGHFLALIIDSSMLKELQQVTASMARCKCRDCYASCKASHILFVLCSEDKTSGGNFA